MLACGAEVLLCVEKVINRSTRAARQLAAAKMSWPTTLAPLESYGVGEGLESRRLAKRVKHPQEKVGANACEHLRYRGKAPITTTANGVINLEVHEFRDSSEERRASEL